MWSISKPSSIGPKKYLFSNRCCIHFYFSFAYLKPWKCSFSTTCKRLPVCPIYCILQSGQVNWSMPHLLNFPVLMFLFTFNILTILLSVKRNFESRIFKRLCNKFDFFFYLCQFNPYCWQIVLLAFLFFPSFFDDFIQNGGIILFINIICFINFFSFFRIHYGKG